MANHAANSKGYTELWADYSEGRENAPTLTIGVGISGSGKSTLLREWVNKSRGTTVRFNRDQIRAMSYVDVPWSHHNEEFTRRFEQEGVALALRMGKDVIVDDTNTNRRVRYQWEEVARDSRCKFRIILMTTPVEVCIERDLGRQGKCPMCLTPIHCMEKGEREGVCTKCKTQVKAAKECVGEAVVRRQFKDLSEATVQPNMFEAYKPNRATLDREALRAGEFSFRLKDAPIILCDVDGTLADHIGGNPAKPLRSPFDEKRVLVDGCHERVAQRIRELYTTHNILIVSGRHAACCPDTEIWLEVNNIPYDGLLMRSDGDSRSDAIVKPELLADLLTTIPKSQIACVFDDRKRVIDAWKAAGLKVQVCAAGDLIDYPTWEHNESCTFVEFRNYRRCPDCGCLENF
jgi:predicted kinase